MSAEEASRREVVLKGTVTAVAAVAGLILGGAGRGLGRLAEGTPDTRAGPRPRQRPRPTRHASSNGPSGSGGSHPAGTAIGPAKDVPVGGAASFADPRTGDPSIVIQATAGKFVAFDAVCPHAGCTVEYDQSAALVICPCHGSQFNAATGAVEVAMMAMWKIGPAFAAGCTSVLKPAENTPLSTFKLAEIAADIVPPGVLNVIGGHGDPAGSSLVTHPGVDFVSLTGSPETGKWIARAAADSLKRVHLELGGKAPVIIFDDYDPETALEFIAATALFNAGQDCTAATRILASEAVYDDVVNGLAEQAKGSVIGDLDDPDTTLGPVISERQRDRVGGFFERRPEHAEVVTGGQNADRPGFYFEPTVVADVQQDDEMVQNEIFGPVMTVQRFDDEAKAIEWANGTRYGLAASVWTRDIARAFRVSKAIRFGAVWINNHITMASEMPHGGFKQSGYGKDMSAYSVEDYTIVKHVCVNLETS